jgi:integrase
MTVTKNWKMSLNRRSPRTTAEIFRDCKIEKSQTESGLAFKNSAYGKRLDTDTVKQYANRLTHLTTCANHIRGRQQNAPIGVYSEEDWYRFVRCEMSGTQNPMDHKTVGGYLDALIDAQRGRAWGLSRNQRSWAADPEHRKTLRQLGFDNGVGKDKPVRGAITAAMTEQFIDFLRKKGKHELVNMVRVAHYVGPRKGQLLWMRVGDLQLHQDGRWRTILRLNKSANWKNSKTNIHFKEVTEMGKLAIKIAAEGKEPGSLLFPVHEARASQMYDLVKEAAVTLKWPANGVVYEGFHAYRHGYAVELLNNEKGFDKIWEFALQCKTVFLWYARSYEERCKN